MATPLLANRTTVTKTTTSSKTSSNLRAEEEVDAKELMKRKQSVQYDPMDARKSLYDVLNPINRHRETLFGRLQGSIEELDWKDSASLVGLILSSWAVVGVVVYFVTFVI